MLLIKLQFEGSITIWPRTRFLDWIRILSDPDRIELKRMMRMGELATWPKLHIVENRFKIENEILKGRRIVRDTIKYKKSQNYLDFNHNLLLNNSDFESKQVNGTAQGIIDGSVNLFNDDDESDDSSTVDENSSDNNDNDNKKNYLILNKKSNSFSNLSKRLFAPTRRQSNNKLKKS